MDNKKFRNITVYKEDYDFVVSWANSSKGLSKTGAIHQIIELVKKYQKITHKDAGTGKFDGKGKGS